MMKKKQLALLSQVNREIAARNREVHCRGVLLSKRIKIEPKYLADVVRIYRHQGSHAVNVGAVEGLGKQTIKYI